jgi:hypothetical protein
MFKGSLNNLSTMYISTSLLTIIVAILAIYVYRNLVISNYFFSIFFYWSKVYELFGISEEEYKTFEIGVDYKKLISNNVNEWGPLLDDKGIACFEYYIIPRAVKGSYSYGHLFDQQNKTFFETPNTIYRGVLKGKSKDGENVSISCGFGKGALSAKVAVNRKSCLWIHYSKETSTTRLIQKTLVILFNEDCLNMRNAHSFNGKIQHDIYLIEYQEGSESKVKKVEVNKDDLKVKDNFHLCINVQSQQDAQSNPVIRELYKYFNNNSKK